MKILIVLLLCTIHISLKAQYSNFVANGPGNPQYIYIGSLAPSNVNNLQKIKVDVFGGAWESNSTGETTYYIANRGGLIVNQVTLGSSNLNRFTLKAYHNTTTGQLDFYVVTNNYTAIMIKSVLLDGANNGSLVSIIASTAPPAGLAEETFTINPVIITDAGGNMAFGTNNLDPTYKLSVNGSVRAKEIKVEVGWADYVFDKHYPLKSLKEVENYINLNKHLPDVPSAADVAQNGVKVGETESMLLKKVEELTLYLIEKDKTINNQQEQINTLSKQMQEVMKKLL